MDSEDENPRLRELEANSEEELLAMQASSRSGVGKLSARLGIRTLHNFKSRWFLLSIVVGGLPFTAAAPRRRGHPCSPSAGFRSSSFASCGDAMERCTVTELTPVHKNPDGRCR